jgi:mitochondrial fission protein ELM1
MKVAILSDDRPGHFNQSKGVVNLISEDIDLEYTVFSSKLKLHFLRSPLKLYQKFLAKNFNKDNAKKIIKIFQHVDLKDFDLLISSGGNTIYHSAALSNLFNIKNIHIGSIKGINLANFEAHITTDAAIDSPNNIVTDLAPTRFKPDIKKKSKSNKLLFLLGGKGAGYLYDESDCKNLIKNIKDFVEIKNISPIIVTSRRTNKIHESLIFDEINTISDVASVWFHKTGENADLNSIFKMVDAIYVSEDSATMTTEAISSGLPVFTLYPKSCNPSEKFHQQLEKYEAMKLIKRMSFNSELSTISTSNNSNSLVLEIREKLKKQILYKIR